MGPLPRNDTYLHSTCQFQSMNLHLYIENAKKWSGFNLNLVPCMNHENLRFISYLGLTEMSFIIYDAWYIIYSAIKNDWKSVN